METVGMKNVGKTTVTRLSRTDEIGALLDVFAQIAAEEGWQPGEALAALPATACYFAVRVGNELAGGLQVVLPDEKGHLPCQSVWPEAVLPERSAHVPILAIRRTFRGHPRLFWPLCVELWRFCAGRGVQTILLEATPPMLARYRRLGWPLSVIGDLRPHWGEACCLLQLDMQAVAGAMLLRSLRSPTFRTLVTQAARSLREADCP